MKSAVLLLLVILSISCRQQDSVRSAPKIQHTDSTENHTTVFVDEATIFLLTGMASPASFVEDRDSILTRKYSFEVKRLWYCGAPSSLVDSVNSVNIKADSIMRLRHGKYWLKHFEQKTKRKVYIQFVN